MTDATPILLMTRPEPESQRFVADLQARGAGPFRALISPLIGISYSADMPDLAQVSAVILTSRHAVAALVAAGVPCTGRAYAVGGATSRAAAEAGFDVVDADGDAEALIALITARAPEGQLLHLRGTHSRGEVAERLSEAGLKVVEQVVYDQPAQPLSEQAVQALAGQTPVVAPLFSPRTAALLAGYPIQAPLSVAAMSESVAKAFGSLHIRDNCVAARPAAVEMLAVTAGLLSKARKLVATPRDV